MSYGFDKDQFYVEYKPCARPVDSVRTEFARRAFSIAQNKNIVLSYSGGTDSQASYLAFKDAGLNVDCAFLHMPGYNDNEYKNVLDQKAIHGFDLEIIVIDPYKEKTWILEQSNRLQIPPNQILHSLFLSKLPNNITFVEGFNGPDPYVHNNTHYILESANSVEYARLRAYDELCPNVNVIGFEKEEHVYLSVLKEGTLTAFMNAWDYYKIPDLAYGDECPISVINYWDLFVKPIFYGKNWGGDITYNYKYQGCEKIDYIINGMEHRYRENQMFVPVKELIDFLENGSGIKRYWQR
jgi:hypothetical protein